MPSRLPPSPQRFKGQNLAEFALTVPFVVLFMLFTIEVGRVWFVYEAVKVAAVEGAQTAAMNNNAGAGSAAAMMRLGNSGVEGGSANISQVAGQHAYQATAQAQFTPLFGRYTLPFLGTAGFNGFSVRYSAIKGYSVY